MKRHVICAVAVWPPPLLSRPDIVRSSESGARCVWSVTVALDAPVKRRGADRERPVRASEDERRRGVVLVLPPIVQLASAETLSDPPLGMKSASAGVASANARARI
jgi:hypothetical protein